MELKTQKKAPVQTTKNLSAQRDIRVRGLSDNEFRRFSNLIYQQCGINLPKAKRTMLSVRLNKRLKALGIPTYQRYFEYVTSGQGKTSELVQMINVVSTNKTDFFREEKHFNFLSSEALPRLQGDKHATSGRPLNVWSAGCSSGEEPYTLAMVLEEYFEKQNSGTYSVLATDISTRVLSTAQKAIYPNDAVKTVPQKLKQKYLMRGKGRQAGYVRVVPELRKNVTFKRLNLTEGRNFGLKKMMDIIFCRNVIIYFDRPTQIRLFEKFYRQLAPGGYLFIGHSETLHGINEQFVPVAVAVYEKPA
jgi:chemotaxis protein methyltransferase CheR